MQNKSILHNSSYHFVGQKFPQNTYICGSYFRMRLLLSTITFCKNNNHGYYYRGGFYSSTATIMDTMEWYFQNYHYWSHFWMYFCRRSGLLKNSKQQQIEIKRIFCFYRMMTRVGKDDMGGKEEKSCSEEMISFSVLFWQGHNKHTMFFCYRY